MSLCEDDVPGAKFVFENIEDHSVQVIKRWLYCRGLKQTGRKVELIERCKNHIAAGQSHIISNAVDNGRWYNAKFGEKAAATPTTSFVTSWKQFPSVDLPRFFNKGHIYHYFVETKPDLPYMSSDDSAPPSEGESEEEESAADISTSKPFRRGQQYVDSGNVSCVEDAIQDNKYVIRGSIKSSFRTSTYLVEAVIFLNSAHIDSAACQCKQSRLGRCSHVMALLLVLNNRIEMKGNLAESCTGRARQWGQGTSQKNPGPVKSKDYTGKKVRQHRSEFDPRSSSRDQENSKEVKNSFLQALEGENRDIPTLWQSILKYTYPDFAYSEEEINILKQQCKLFKENMSSMFADKERFCILNTENQSNDFEWSYWRSYLITSSNAKITTSLCSSASKKNFLKKHLWGFNPLFKTKAMAYGSTNEETARKTYLDYINKEYPGSSVRTTGLWVCQKYPLLGCSPDGLVIKSGEERLLEIKCPYILRDDSPEDFTIRLSAKQLSGFCLGTTDDGFIKLKETHSYYYQIQMAMAITGRKFCDFVVWSRKGFLLIEVPFNGEFAESVCDKLQKIHEELVAPEYFAQRCVRDLDPIEL